MFVLKNINKTFTSSSSKQVALSSINLSFPIKGLVFIKGESGSGKSTLLNIIGGIDNADSGYVSINGEKTADMDEKKLTLYRRKHLGYVFQMYNLIPNLNVKENIEVGAAIISSSTTRSCSGVFGICRSKKSISTVTLLSNSVSE